MIEKIGQVMLYVENQAAVRDFWVEKLDFVVVSEEVVNGEIQWIEIAPTKGVETTFVLQNKKKVAEMNPEMNLGILQNFMKNIKIKALRSAIWAECLIFRITKEITLRFAKNNKRKSQLIVTKIISWLF
ncbi:Uncharacterized protein yetH [Listeria monocytogenes N53-1]|nr:Uncharacterized protein yetH [Listeria monocytogenes]CCQ24528.1 Uncharacterized protein yetH [Listeria monocytogenes N53-1]